MQTSTCVRRGTCGDIYSTFLYLFGVACVALLALGWVWQRALALGDIDVPFAWQAWPLGASTLVSRGRRGTYGTGLSTFTRDFVTHNSFTCNSFTHHCFTQNSFTNHSFTHSVTHTHTTLSYVQLWHIELFHTRTHDSFVFPSALVLCFLSVHIGSLTSKLPLIRKHKNPPLRLFSVQPLTKLLALSQI